MKSSSGYTAFELLFVIVFVLIFIGAPIGGVIQTMSRQKIINEQCNTHYNFFDIAFNGDSIQELCKMKHQTLTIK